MECINYTTPVQIEDLCLGDRTKTSCVYSPNPFTLLGLDANENLDVILNALVIALNSANTRLNAQDLIIADLEARVALLEL